MPLVLGDLQFFTYCTIQNSVIVSIDIVIALEILVVSITFIRPKFAEVNDSNVCLVLTLCKIYFFSVVLITLQRQHIYHLAGLSRRVSPYGCPLCEDIRTCR